MKNQAVTKLTIIHKIWLRKTNLLVLSQGGSKEAKNFKDHSTLSFTKDFDTDYGNDYYTYKDEVYVQAAMATDSSDFVSRLKRKTASAETRASSRSRANDVSVACSISTMDSIDQVPMNSSYAS